MSDVRKVGAALPEAADRPIFVRWVAAFALAMATLGLALCVSGEERWPILMVGSAMSISIILFAADAFVAPERVNARGKRWKPRPIRALFQGFLAVGALAAIGLPILSLSSGLGGWVPASHDDWQVVMLALQTVLWAVPLAYPKFAGWVFDGVN